MEPMSSIVGAIVKLLQEIAKAEKAARRNKTRCRELAGRAEVIASVLRDSKVSARADATATRRSILCRLKEALDDALKLVESCRLSDGLLSRLLTSHAKAARFDDVDKRITSCLVDLNAATGVSVETKINQLAVAARDHRPRANNSKQIHAGNAPPIDNKGGRNNKRRGKKKKAGAARPPAPPLIAHAGAPCYPNGHGYLVYHHCIEEDPTSCAVM